jgi:hypothetical protein
MKFRIVLVAAKLLAVGAILSLAGCYQQGTLEGTHAEHITVNGRKLKVNVASTGTPNEYRLLVVRETIGINVDPEIEAQRGQEAARRVMETICKGRASQVISEGLGQQVNWYTLFRCLPDRSP